MIACENLAPYFAPVYKNLPESRFVSILLLRTTMSEAIFRTEGSGEGCNKEVIANGDGEPVFRAVISKRKQTAVERREGRQLLRKHGLLFTSEDKEISDENVCSLNRNNPCGRCIDCFVYGYAVGSGGAQKSRVVTDDAFSLLAFEQISARKTFNALFENNTMRDPVTKEPSTSIGEDEYILPGVHFLDIEVLKDVTEEEFVYVLGNILRSKRYGAVTSRIGSVSNTVLSIVGSDTEIFSTLEWVHETVAALSPQDLEHPQKASVVQKAVSESIDKLLGGVCGSFYRTKPDELARIFENVRDRYIDEVHVAEALRNLTRHYPQNEGIVP